MSNLSQVRNKVNSTLSVLVAVALSLLLGACGGGGGAAIVPGPGLGGASPTSDGNTVSTDTGAGAGGGGAITANIGSGNFVIGVHEQTQAPAPFTGLSGSFLDFQFPDNQNELNAHGAGAAVGSYCAVYWQRNGVNTTCRTMGRLKVYTVQPREGLVPPRLEYMRSLTGTVTWNGDYQGEYRRHNGSGWAPFQKDSGTAEITVDFDMGPENSKEVMITLSSETGNNTFPSTDGGYTDEISMIGPTALDTGGFQAASGGTRHDNDEVSYTYMPRHVQAVGGWYGILGQSAAGAYQFDTSLEADTDDRIQGLGVFVTEREIDDREATAGAEVTTTTTTTTTTVGDYLSLGVWGENAERPDALFTWAQNRDSGGTAGFYVDGDLTATTTVTAMTGTASWDGRYSGNYRTRDLGDNEKADYDDAWNAHQTDTGDVALMVDFSSGFDADAENVWTPEVEMTMTSDNTGAVFPNGENMLSAIQGHVDLTYDRTYSGVDENDGSRTGLVETVTGYSNQFSGAVGGEDDSWTAGSSRLSAGWSADYMGGFFGPNGEAVGGLYTLTGTGRPSVPYHPDTRDPNLAVDIFQGQGTFSASKNEE